MRPAPTRLVCSPREPTTHSTSRAARQLEDHLGSCVSCQAAELRAQRADRAFAGITGLALATAAPAVAEAAVPEPEPQPEPEQASAWDSAAPIEQSSSEGTSEWDAPAAVPVAAAAVASGAAAVDASGETTSGWEAPTGIESVAPAAVSRRRGAPTVYPSPPGGGSRRRARSGRRRCASDRVHHRLRQASALGNVRRGDHTGGRFDPGACEAQAQGRRPRAPSASRNQEGVPSSPGCGRERAGEQLECGRFVGRHVFPAAVEPLPRRRQIRRPRTPPLRHRRSRSRRARSARARRRRASGTSKPAPSACGGLGSWSE